MTQYAVCYTLENPPPGAELVCFNRLVGGDTPAETLLERAEKLSEIDALLAQFVVNLESM